VVHEGHREHVEGAPLLELGLRERARVAPRRRDGLVHAALERPADGAQRGRRHRAEVARLAEAAHDDERRDALRRAPPALHAVELGRAVRGGPARVNRAGAP